MNKFFLGGNRVKRSIAVIGVGLCLLLAVPAQLLRQRLPKELVEAYEDMYGEPDVIADYPGVGRRSRHAVRVCSICPARSACATCVVASYFACTGQIGMHMALPQQMERFWYPSTELRAWGVASNSSPSVAAASLNM